MTERKAGSLASSSLATSCAAIPQIEIRRFAADFPEVCGRSRNYLWEEVIGQQSEEIQAFLLRTSILERFTAALCDAVIEEHRAPRLFASWNRIVSSSLRWMMSVIGIVITICFLTCCATDWNKK